MIPGVSKSLVCEIVKERLDYQKYLKTTTKKNWMGAAQTFLTLCSEEANEFLDSIVTGDESEWFTKHLTPNYSWWCGAILIVPWKRNSKHQQQENCGNCLYGLKGGSSGWFYTSRTTINIAAWNTEKAWTSNSEQVRAADMHPAYCTKIQERTPWE